MIFAQTDHLWMRSKRIDHSCLLEMLFTKYLWVWNTEDVIKTTSAVQELVQHCKDLGVGNVFLRMAPDRYDTMADGLKLLISNLNRANVKSWSLDGMRKDFSDADGPVNLLRGIDNLIKYNEKVADNEKFIGFQTDMEINDIPGYKSSFHNDIGDSKLDKNGGGVWKSSQAADREALVVDLLTTHDLIKDKLSGKNITLGAAIPAWWDDYNGDPISANYKDTKQDIFKHLSGIVSEIHIMAYNTNPETLKSRIDNELSFLSSGSVKACAGIELNSVGSAEVSYADTGKNTRTAVLGDIANIEKLLQTYSSFAGVCIHDYEAYLALKN
eukprot:NODE_678_length_4811_cov_0.248302.p2 type:complete len:327 gc:universal NODE_678_length_4811_cov_0.248302:1498-518(-)